MKLSFLLIFSVFVLSVVSCSRSKTVKDLEKIINQQVHIPKFNNVILEGKDTVLTIPSHAKAKMIVFYGPDECSSCNATTLYQWDMVTQFAESTNGLFAPIFIFSPVEGKEKELNIILKSLRLDFPVYVDKTNKFWTDNKFIPKERRYHVFLADKDNRVVLAGNPLNNPKLWDMYKKNITEIMRQ